MLVCYILPSHDIDGKIFYPIKMISKHNHHRWGMVTYCSNNV
jgi:hypothetical protein